MSSVWIIEVKFKDDPEWYPECALAYWRRDSGYKELKRRRAGAYPNPKYRLTRYVPSKHLGAGKGEKKR